MRISLILLTAVLTVTSSLVDARSTRNQHYGPNKCMNESDPVSKSTCYRKVARKSFARWDFTRAVDYTLLAGDDEYRIYRKILARAGYKGLSSVVKKVHSNDDFETYKKQIKYWVQLLPPKKVFLKKKKPLKYIANLMAGKKSLMRNETERAYALFYWVGQNLEYNIDGFKKGIPGSSNPLDAITTGSCVCGGFANTFQRLASLVNLEAITITGYAKGSGYLPGQNIPEFSNHAWAAIKINSKWHLLDPTWGSGSSMNGQYVRKTKDCFFMTDPSRLIYTHYPDQEKWQLLDDPVTRAEFERLPYYRSEMFEYGVKFASDSHNSCILESEDRRVSMKFDHPDHVYFDINVLDKRRNITTETEKKIMRLEGGHSVIALTLPGPGTYQVEIFAGTKSKKKEGGIEYTRYSYDYASGVKVIVQ